MIRIFKTEADGVVFHSYWKTYRGSGYVIIAERWANEIESPLDVGAPDEWNAASTVLAELTEYEVEQVLEAIDEILTKRMEEV